MEDDFVFIDEFSSGIAGIAGIRWDAKYATWDNFTGKPVDGYLANRIVGTRALGEALERAREQAETQGFGLLLWDGYRPQRAVDCFMRWSQLPEDGRTKARHYPNIGRAEMFEQGYVAAKSGHSRGSTVDLTLYDLASQEIVPMGGGHDLMDPLSHHGAQGITQAEARNRRHLRTIMEACGFIAYDCEWWHYTLADEPYPDTYFDFPITSSSRGGVRRRDGVPRRAVGVCRPEGG
ncbi:D-Ala-D-Ala dipeptidase VanX [Streptomyces mutabilis]|uniref:D-Ala-D-Ala dipeptidase VanX n=1 Tax=Streptomyces mutabilis TaxID=67332 RepID=UPI003790C201